MTHNYNPWLSRPGKRNYKIPFSMTCTNPAFKRLPYKIKASLYIFNVSFTLFFFFFFSFFFSRTKCHSGTSVTWTCSLLTSSVLHSSHLVFPGSFTKVHMGQTLRPSWASDSRSASHPRHTRTWGPFTMVQRLHCHGKPSSFLGFFVPILAPLTLAALGPLFLRFDTKLCPAGFVLQERDNGAQDGQ